MSTRRRLLQVVVRLRCDDAERRPTKSCVTFDTSHSEVCLTDTTIASGGIQRAFHVDAFVPASSNNEDLFNTVCKTSIDDASGDDTLCFLAYGHTNSGKTHTIAGSSSGEPGILTQCALHLIERFGAVDVTMLEVYAEGVFDMLAGGQPRRIRRIPSSNATGAPPSIVVEHLTCNFVTNPQQWFDVAEKGMAQRRTSPMDLNARSSRSHAIFTLKSPSGLKVCLVDLAGSERQSLFSKKLNTESIAINKSLSRLSTVIQALSGRSRQPVNKGARGGSASYVNFRDTTLTVLLQRYLSGSSATSFIGCVHPNAFFMAETLSTLRYTTRLQKVTTDTLLPRSGYSSRSGSTHSLYRHGSEPSVAAAEASERLLTELLAVRKELAELSVMSTRREEFQLQRIAELERAQESLLAERSTLMLSSDAPRGSDTAACLRYHVDPNATVFIEVGASSLNTSCATSICGDDDRLRSSRRSSGGSSGSGRRGGGGSNRDTKRVAGWLLSRCMSFVPQFNVSFDDYYFQDSIPSSLTSIGYVSCMACLLPRDPSDFTVRIGVLDVGDLVIGLTMLDAGIPPFVALHDGGTCRSPRDWETFELTPEGPKVYALAMFNVPSDQVEHMRNDDEDANDDNASCNNGSSAAISPISPSIDVEQNVSCCKRFCSCEPLVPFAILFAVTASDPLEHHEAVYAHLAALQAHQDALCDDVCQLTTTSMTGRNTPPPTAEESLPAVPPPPFSSSSFHALEEYPALDDEAQVAQEPAADIAIKNNSASCEPLAVWESPNRECEEYQLNCPFSDRIQPEAPTSSDASDSDSPSATDSFSILDIIRSQVAVDNRASEREVTLAAQQAEDNPRDEDGPQQHFGDLTQLSAMTEQHAVPDDDVDDVYDDGYHNTDVGRPRGENAHGDAASPPWLTHLQPQEASLLFDVADTSSATVVNNNNMSVHSHSVADVTPSRRFGLPSPSQTRQTEGSQWYGSSPSGVEIGHDLAAVHFLPEAPRAGSSLREGASSRISVESYRSPQWEISAEDPSLGVRHETENAAVEAVSPQWQRPPLHEVRPRVKEHRTIERSSSTERTHSAGITNSSRGVSEDAPSVVGSTTHGSDVERFSVSDKSLRKTNKKKNERKNIDEAPTGDENVVCQACAIM